MTNAIMLGNENGKAFCTIDLSHVLVIKKEKTGLIMLFKYNGKTFFNVFDNADSVFNSISVVLVEWANKHPDTENVVVLNNCLINVSQISYTRMHEDRVQIVFKNGEDIVIRYEEPKNMVADYCKIAKAALG